ncbi:MAG: hypothetical protein A2138_21355 [Deltaproteobacteria bacterium RBG_16_71_12]|nr:MAG: hypothetical protein A2138_21355 [Deltaproteobacteria bacterium RBG_16_71_12]
MNDQVKRQLQTRIESFAADITAILQQAMADAVTGAARSRPTSVALPVSKRGALKPAIAGDALLREIARKPGLRIEQIAKNLGVPSKSLKAPVARLVKAKKLKKSGQARGTKYRLA